MILFYFVEYIVVKMAFQFHLSIVESLFMMIPFNSTSSIHTNAPNKNAKSLKKGAIHA
jgi:hypothetical protein